MAGEGPTDLGGVDYETRRFAPGPFGRLIDKLLNAQQGYEFSYIQNDCIRYIDKSQISKRKFVRLPGKRMTTNSAETKYFFKAAANLGVMALEIAQERRDTTLAVLFRDVDHPSRQSTWVEKHTSMVAGFELVRFNSGVPMLPDTCSEVWLLAALLRSPMIEGRRLEAIADRDWLKAQVRLRLSPGTAERDLEIDVDAIPDAVMSYSRFKDDLVQAFDRLPC